MAFQEKNYTGLYQHFFSTKEGLTADPQVIADVDHHCQRVLCFFATAVTQGLLPRLSYFHDQSIRLVPRSGQDDGPAGNLFFQAIN